MNAASDVATKAVSEAEKAGASIGASIGAAYILFVWAIGDVITGLLAWITKPRS